MHALIVTAHPDPNSYTQKIVSQVAQGIATHGSHTYEIADLAAEQFDPRFNQADFEQFKSAAPSPADVLAEQQRLDRADALILVYPIYWWSFPAQLKGWIDRVFTQGWAYLDDGERVEKKLGRLQVHLLAIGAASQRTYVRRGYFSSMRKQIDEGIFGYCGAPVITSELLLPSDDHYPDAHYTLAHQLGHTLFHAKD
ncbi:NAD(P)H-dependent oxidoreductase [Pantoea sp.]|uniref:NAD(P)H-dependent oxidoreductase n=1 Tax=Pantoea sp. TaxID=69393 RepID=UPI0031E39FB8